MAEKMNQNSYEMPIGCNVYKSVFQRDYRTNDETNRSPTDRLFRGFGPFQRLYRGASGILRERISARNRALSRNERENNYATVR